MIVSNRLVRNVMGLALSVSLLGAGPVLAGERLANAASDYLQEHADNPVDWYPWGPEALRVARETDRPLFVSVGYSTCYWCHVAERELYEDPEIAAVMNRHFVNVKIDREQRPDLDRVLMAATRELGGAGGWPNNVFLTPELEPFFAGSYFPPEPLPGRESFPQLLERLAGEWRSDRAGVKARAEAVSEALSEQADAAGLDPERIEPARWRREAVEALEAEFDPLVGGFAPAGQASRFPQSPRLMLLFSALDDDTLADRSREMLNQTLVAMSVGGLFDHVGGGFHRYTVDPEWAIPHFEKMLVDNAQLVGLYARAGARLEQPWFSRVADRTGDYLARRLAADGGGFFTGENAEVDGVEGAGHVLSAAEIREVLGERAERFLAWHELVPLPESRVDHELPAGGAVNLTPGRAFTALETGELAGFTQAMAEDYAALRDYRAQRGLPSRDRKRLAELNALTGLGLLDMAHYRDRGDRHAQAVKTGEWIWDTLWDGEAEVLRRQAYAGEVSGEVFLADYAAVGRLMLALYGTQHEAKWLFRAQRIARVIEARYLDAAGRLHERALTGVDRAGMPLAPPLVGDDVAPSGHGQAVVFLLDLGGLLDDPARQRRAVQALAGFAGEVEARPADWGWLVGELARPSRAAVLRERVETMSPQAGEDGPGESGNHVSASARLVEDGSAIELRLVIEPGFHVNANPASEDYLVPTRVRAADGEIGPVDYPPGKPFRAAFAGTSIDVYEGELRLRVSFDGPPPERLIVDLQACNDEVCLSPDEIEVQVDGVAE